MSLTFSEQVVQHRGFVKIPGGEVQLGTDNPLPCRIEGCRRNETPMRTVSVKPFWMAQACVTNHDFEKFLPKHFRPPTSDRENDPVTDLTYGEALYYIDWLSRTSGLLFDLPTEAEWMLAAAPAGWWYAYQAEARPQTDKAHTFNRCNYHTLMVSDDRYGVNCHGLYHMSGNVLEMTKGWYYAGSHSGYASDGAYYLVKGGSFGNCPYSARIVGRMMFDVSCRCSRVGMRLVYRLDT